MMDNNFYVYAYLDKRNKGCFIYEDLKFDYEPFYVGKGKNKRYKDHFLLRNNIENHFYHKLNKMINEGFQPDVIIIMDNLNENDAFLYEMNTIKKIGRKNVNTGPLTNLTEGGEGSSGRVCEEKTKLKISLSNTGKRNGMYHKVHPMRGKSFDEFFGDKSKDIKIKISKNANPFWKNKKLPDDMKQKISDTLKLRFQDKEKHSRFGKKLSNKSKQKISDSLVDFYKKNPKIVSNETRKKQSIAAKNKKFIIEIKNLESNDIIKFYSIIELKKFISDFKKEKGICKTCSPSYSLLIKGKNNKFFILVDKYFSK